MMRRPPRSPLSSSSAASDVYKRQLLHCVANFTHNSNSSDLLSLPYPEHAGSATIMGTFEALADLENDEQAPRQRYMFASVDHEAYSLMREQWYESKMGELRRSNAFKPSAEETTLTQSANTVHLPKSERFYLKSLEVPSTIDSLVDLIQEKWKTGGKSGAPLYFSQDSKLVIKVLEDDEFKFLVSFAAPYRKYMDRNPLSLLLRVGGLYKIQMRPQQNVFSFMVMYNAAPCSSVFCRYDLKGSTSGRCERPADQHRKDDSSLTSQWQGWAQYSGVLLDLDFEEDMTYFERPIVVSMEAKEQLLAQIFKDVCFLAAQRVMDYSLYICRAKTQDGQLPASAVFHELHCLHSATTSGECYFFSFLDISQEYTVRKASERVAKVGVLRRDRWAVSTSPPGYYAHRFVQRMNEYIQPELDEEHPLMVKIAQEDWRSYDYFNC
eukprot:TRINITY_DN3586_c0_g2_i1.p1 TRINITY_DN3586_c0_g2~~TRINITY_DN3586_c0_g2_i1.p1  ORF type:complete len:438 (-),score=102.33 TRINITY_DN3586_c0_g2_i1:93-1406(-)